MADNEARTFMVENAQIIFRNFTGREGKYNVEGARNFSCILPPELAEQLARDGWNVKVLQPRDEGDVETPYIPIEVGYKIRPPRIVLITDTSRTQLNEATVSVLDWADIRTADLIARASYWNVGDKSGIKAYLQSLFVTIEEDLLEAKYRINEEPIRSNDG